MELFNSIESASDFWKQLLSDTNKLQEPVLYQGVLDLSFDDESVFKNFFNQYSTDPDMRQAAKIRVYEESLKDNNLLLSLIQAHPPKADDSLSTWGQALFKGDPWCIILDKVSGCIDELAHPIAKWIEPLVATYSPGSFVVDISPYIGKYGYTPFGAHVDIPGISILHLHLGPNPKHMTLWSQDEFRKLTGSDATVFHDYKSYLSEGTTYTINAGDIFHLPASTYYHIGRTDDFSIGVTIGLKRESPHNILRRALMEHELDSPEISKSAIVESYKLKKQSNAGFIKSPLLKNLTPADFINKSIRINAAFPLILKSKNKDHSELYIRGRKLILQNHSEVLKIIGLLNEKKSILLSDSFFNSKKFDQLTTLKFVAELYNHGGILVN